MESLEYGALSDCTGDVLMKSAMNPEERILPWASVGNMEKTNVRIIFGITLSVG